MAAEPGFDPLQVIRALNAHGVDFMIVGGFAVAAHGVVRATRDLDLVVDRGLGNAERLSAALSDLGAESATEPSAELTPELLARRADRLLATRFGDVHLLRDVPGLPTFRELLPGTQIELEGERVLVCSLADLRRAKSAAGRAKDLVDLAELDELHGPETS